MVEERNSLIILVLRKKDIKNCSYVRSMYSLNGEDTSIDTNIIKKKHFNKKVFLKYFQVRLVYYLIAISLTVLMYLLFQTLVFYMNNFGGNIEFTLEVFVGCVISLKIVLFTIFFNLIFTKTLIYKTGYKFKDMYESVKQDGFYMGFLGVTLFKNNNILNYRVLQYDYVNNRYQILLSTERYFDISRLR